MITLAQIIARVESSGNQFALRFEMVTYGKINITDAATIALLDKIAAANKCNLATSRMIYATSWGRYQIMGFNLYGDTLKLTMPIGQYMASPDVQDGMFSTFTADQSGGWDGSAFDQTKGLAFARFYNGPGDPAAYFQAMQEAATALVKA